MFANFARVPSDLPSIARLNEFSHSQIAGCDA